MSWHRGKAWGVGYGRQGNQRHARLYESRDGLKFNVLLETLHEAGNLSEASILFGNDDTALCLLRRNGAEHSSALLGSSRLPYTSWEWKDLGKRVGEPALIRLPQDILIAGTRLYSGRTRTSLSLLDPEQGTLSELLALPSAGDNSYPGLVWYDDLLWVSYYSSHEGKSSIYLAKVRLLQ